MARKFLFSVTKKDLIIQTFTAGGKGGQHQNKTETGVRIIHPPSGAVGEARDSKSQHTNKKNAFERLCKSKRFRTWVRLKAAEIESGMTLEEKVEEQVNPKNLRIEVRNEKGKWAPFLEE